MIFLTQREVISIAIFHAPIKIIQRSKGRSAVAAAAYRSGTKLTNKWDGLTHDYTKKRGIVHTEIMLPAHAPPEFSNRSTLWNSVEMNEKAKDSQLAREIEVALPMELPREEQLNLIRAYIRDTFVAAGMCADFALHDKGDGNPHAHIMLTVRPLTETGQWGAKCRKVYDLDNHGQRIPDGKGGWKNHRENITDWNDRDKAEEWRAAWADYVNRALEAAGRPERIDHRSYKRQGIDMIPTVHMGVAATQMERRGIQTEKGNTNRQIAADNRLLKEIKARITRLYNWSKEQAAQPQGRESVMSRLMEARLSADNPVSRNGRLRTLKENATLLNFLTGNGIQSMQQLYEKISAMNRDYYDLRGQIVSGERRLRGLDERLEMWAQYEKFKPVYRQLEKLKPEKRNLFREKHSADLALFHAAARYLENLESTGEAITPKIWQAEVDSLTAQRTVQYQQMVAMREQIKAVENLKKTAEQLSGIKSARRDDREI